MSAFMSFCFYSIAGRVKFRGNGKYDQKSTFFSKSSRLQIFFKKFHNIHRRTTVLESLFIKKRL